MRSAGSRCLSVFTHALNAGVLRDCEKEARSRRALERRLGWAAESTLRNALKGLSELGALRRLEPSTGASAALYELTEMGDDLLEVGRGLEDWLAQAPAGAIPLEESGAFGTIRALTAAWDSGIVRELAKRPSSLLELSARTSGVSYPTLKRRLGKLRSTRLAGATSCERHEYEASSWLRRAAYPLALGARWECRHDAAGGATALPGLEDLFLLALPLIKPPKRRAGTCAFAIVDPAEVSRRVETTRGATLLIEGGGIAWHRAPAKPKESWALGAVDAWLDAMIDGNCGGLRFGGPRPHLAETTARALHAALSTR